MGFSVWYSLTQQVSPETEQVILDAIKALRHGRTWLSCEPPSLHNHHGILFGSSKPNFMPDPDDVASAESEGLPDGTLNDLLDILCRISRQFGVDWEISHDDSDGPLGYIRGGDCEEAVYARCNAISELADILGAGGYDDDDL